MPNDAPFPDFEDYCHTSVDCKVVLKSSSVQCRNNHCVCDYGYKMNKDTMECDSSECLKVSKFDQTYHKRDKSF